MKIISLFAGCGGLDLGFKQAGFKIVWANEFDKSIHATYKLNHPETIFNGKDIRSLKLEDIPNCDGIIGGPPCQSWSVGGRGLGINDERGKLFLNYISIVEIKKPKFFLIENVAGILEDKHREAFSMFLNRLSSAGYNIEYALINAVDFKIPQDRYRIFIIGIRNDLNKKFKFPDIISIKPVSLKESIGDIKDLPQFSNGKISICKSNSGIWNHDVYTGPYTSNYMHSNRVRSWHEPSYTIQAQACNAPQHPQAPKMEYSPNGGRVFKKGYEHLYRRLSVRECARIQSFPDSFKFIYDDIKVGYKMVGNAVPPRLAYFLAVQIKNILKPLSCHNSAYKKNQVSELFNSPLKDVLKTNNLFSGSIYDRENPLIDRERNLLIGLTKLSEELNFNTQQGKFYYSGKKFPTTININDLFFFMPYIPRKGVRDVYYIKKIRKGTKKELLLNGDNSVRLIFEIEFITQLYENYMPIYLNLWHTFTNTSLSKILDISFPDY